MKKLYLDLGNTRLKYWLIHNNQILEQDAIQHLQAPAELLMGLTDKFIRLQPDFIGVSSVLGDKINQKIKKTLDKTGIAYQFAKVHSNHQAMQSLYAENQLGVDRWLQMLGGVDITKKQCIIGCGTAITIDIINQGLHIGGYIFPNAYLQRKALMSGTKQIEVNSGLFKSMEIATNTFDAVNNGILLSIVGAIKEIISQDDEYEVIMTGGGAEEIKTFLKQKIVVEKNLLLNGLNTYFNTPIPSDSYDTTRND